MEKATEANVLVMGNSGEPADLDPQVVTGVIESNIIRALFEGLCGQHPSNDGKHLPGAAASWSANENFTVWTFNLQPEGKWSDGKPVTTEDFLYSYERMLLPEFGAKYASMLYYIKGAEAFNKGENDDFSSVGVRAIDSHTLEITLRAPIPFLPDITKHYTWYPVPKHIIEKHGGMLAKNGEWTEAGSLISNGPFVLSKWVLFDRIECVKNPLYWDADTVQLDGINFLPISNAYTEARMFYNDQLHVTYTLAPELISYSQKKYPDNTKLETYLGSNFLRLNVSRPILQNLDLRKALGHAVDSQAIIDNILQGGQERAGGLVPRMGEYQPAEVMFYDPELANEYLKKSGVNPADLSLTLLTTDREGAKVIAEALQDMWRKNLGITVNIRQSEWKSYQKAMSDLDYDISTGGWIGDYPDPTTFLDMWKKGDGNNRTGWSSEEFESLLGKAELTEDPVQRLRALEKAEKVLLAEMPIIPLYWYTQCYLKHGSLKGWHPLILNNHPYKFISLEPANSNSED
ncbi:peptide ABC transporter substrate-binding protein [Verrucomicrobiaceae bacterium 5K15]|uniref:Peptide ABC transporter substrate-binding protein n=1 Tax=Oceaniferula flava TaxID=2800421 RepID=A0AAE2VAN0_9BACT|nr:peptide ABC transporter substrate-binding protein [Oceaniferula flavus]MBK1853485.1 peptide ABC transporter substrate-binding protein [Oceaniferula flavus]MBM1134790.1 peptide ABC transporter substrate-binding protein [Oceaniferula flavus]